VGYSDIIKRLFGHGGEKPRPLPRSTVEHDSIDKMHFDNHTDDSPRFKRIAVEEAPHIAPDVPEPDAPDFTSASREEIEAYQAATRAARAARDNAPAYDAWEDLTRDVFYSYHHASTPEVLDFSKLDPGVRHHAKIIQKMIVEDDHARARNITRDNATVAAGATLASIRVLRDALEDELVGQARESEEFEQARDRAETAMGALENLRAEARQLANAGQPIPGDLVQDIKDAVNDKRQALDVAEQIASGIPSPFSKAAADAVTAAVTAARDAAESAAMMPSFGAGFGEGEPRYESPEQALTIADMWANNPTLRAVAALYGRLDKHMRFERAKRTVGGQDEIVDLKLGDELRRIAPSELVYLADDDYEDDFYMRYMAAELVVYDTVGEEHAGRGPIVLACDESGSMSGERNVWAKAIACCLLNICRREKRDFAYVGFSSGNQVHQFIFPARQALDAQAIVDMASHFFGGGTTPIIGVTAATKIMEDAAEFKKADIVLVGDGEAGFGPEDKMLKERMESRGVRFHGVGIGGSFAYLKQYCEERVVSILDFDLESPSEATAQLATHIQ
jgi:uncharacterized protein with von Willebrand factor type A (vWA) domain